MRLHKQASAFGNPVDATPEVLTAVRRLVQRTCLHMEVRAVDAGGLRLECIDCGHQTGGGFIELVVRSAR